MHQAAYGGTRLVIETPGAANVPLSGGVYQTNHFGLAVLPNVVVIGKPVHQLIPVNYQKMLKH